MKCSNCETDLNSYVPVDLGDCKPNEGDFSVCAHCGTIGQFTNINDEMILQSYEINDLYKLKFTDYETYSLLLNIRSSILAKKSS